MSASMSQTDRAKFYVDTCQPIRLGSGTWYSCTNEDLCSYTRPVPTAARPSRSKAASVTDLTNFLTHQWPNARVGVALDNMRQVLDTPDWGPDILLKMFSDMDVAFFEGQLRNRVRVSWYDGCPSQLGNPPIRDSQGFGITHFDPVDNTCYIFLNRDIILDNPTDPRMMMLETMIHEMVVSLASTMPSHPKSLLMSRPACLGLPHLCPPTSTTCR